MKPRAGARGSLEHRQVGLATALLVAGTAFLSLPRVAATPAGPAGWLAVAAGSLAALPAACLMLALYARHPGLTLVGISRQLLGPFLATLVGLGLAAWGHLCLAVLVREFAGVFLIPFMPETPLSAFLAVFAALLVYAAYQGMEAIVRTAQVFVPFILLSLLVILGGLLPRFVAGRLLPLSGANWPGVGLGALYTFSAFAQGVAATTFLPLLRRPAEARPALIWGFAVAGLAFVLLTVAEIGVFSVPVLRQLAFPTLSAARLIRLGLFFERFEAGFMVVWFVLSFLKLAVFFFFTTATLAELLVLSNQKPLCLPGGLIVAFTAVFPENFSVVLRLVGHLYQYSWLVFLLPALLLLGSWIAERTRNQASGAGAG